MEIIMNEWLSPSSGQRLANCPGSYRAGKGLPELQTSGDAERGTRIHKYISTLLGNVLGGVGDVPENIDVALEERDAAESIMTRLLDLFAKHGKPVDWGIESAVKLYSEANVLLWQGRCDFWFVADDRTLHVCDWKTGFGEVPEAAVNMQTRIYLCAVYLKQVGKGSKSFVDAQAHILTPRGISTAVYTSKDMGDALKEVELIWQNAMDANAPRKTGPWCRYCPALGTGRCQESHAMGRLTLDVCSRGLTAETLGRVLDVAPVIEEAIERARLQAKQMLTENPEAIPGWELKPGVQRRIEDVVGAFSAMRGVLSEEDLRRCCKLGVGAVEEAVRGKLGMKAKEARAFVAERLGGLIEEKQNAPSLKKRGE